MLVSESLALKVAKQSTFIWKQLKNEAVYPHSLLSLTSSRTLPIISSSVSYFLGLWSNIHSNVERGRNTPARGKTSRILAG